MRGIFMKQSSSPIKSIIKSVNLSVIITFVCVLIFSLIIRSLNLSSVAIKSVNQFIKIISIFLGCSCFLRGSGGLFKGAISGFLCAILTHLIFSLFFTSFNVDLSLIVDLIFCSLIGGISGIISVNLKRD